MGSDDDNQVHEAGVGDADDSQAGINVENPEAQANSDDGGDVRSGKRLVNGQYVIEQSRGKTLYGVVLDIMPPSGKWPETVLVRWYLTEERDGRNWLQGAARDTLILC